MTVGEMSTKPVVTADAEEPVIEAARRMRDQHVGDIVVTDAHRRPIGVLTDRDIVVSAVAQSGDKLETLQVGDVMSPDVVTTRSTDSLETALDKMRHEGVRRLPVVSDSGELEGILTFDDILKLRDLADLIGVVARERLREQMVRP